MISKKIKEMTRKVFPVTGDEVENFILNGNPLCKRTFLEGLLAKFLQQLTDGRNVKIKLKPSGPILIKGTTSVEWRDTDLEVKNSLGATSRLVSIETIKRLMHGSVKASHGKVSINNYVLFRDLSDDDMCNAVLGLAMEIESMLERAVDAFENELNEDW